MEAPQKNSPLTGYRYWGPQNTIQGYSPKELAILSKSPLDTTARRHDLDVSYALRLRGSARETALKRADQKFRSKIDNLYRENKITGWERIKSFAVGSPLSTLYYKTLKDK